MILRRVDAAWSDPLELRGDSQLGVAGLVEAVRRGTVRVVNGLGAGVLENPGLLPYLPGGLRGAARRAAPARRRSAPGGAATPTPSTTCCRAPRHAAGARPSTAHRCPRSLGRRELEKRGSSPRRTAGSARSGCRCRRSPTGAGRAARWRGPRRRDPAGVHAALRVGVPPARRRPGQRRSRARRPATWRTSKDVWVIKAHPDDADQGLGRRPAADPRGRSACWCRVLEDMFWLGRYAERAEDMLRLVLTAHASPRTSGPGRAPPAARRSRCSSVRSPAARRRRAPRRHRRRVPVAAARRRPARLGGPLAGRAARRRCRASATSSPVTRGVVFGTIERATQSLLGSRHSHQVAESAGRMLTGVLALQGVTASMMRDPGWHMIGAGRHLERPLQVCHLLAATTTVRRGLEVDREVLNAVLTTAESASPTGAATAATSAAGVLDLLLMDPDNPRSLAFALGELAEHLAAHAASTGSTRPERLVADLAAQVEATEAEHAGRDRWCGRPNLETFLAATVVSLGRIAEATSSCTSPSGPAPRCAHDDDRDGGALSTMRYRVRHLTDVLLRRRGHRLARHRPPGPARVALAAGGVVRVATDPAAADLSQDTTTTATSRRTSRSPSRTPAWRSRRPARSRSTAPAYADGRSSDARGSGLALLLTPTTAGAWRARTSPCPRRSVDQRRPRSREYAAASLPPAGPWARRSPT